MDVELCSLTAQLHDAASRALLAAGCRHILFHLKLTHAPQQLLLPFKRRPPLVKALQLLPRLRLNGFLKLGSRRCSSPAEAMGLAGGLVKRVLKKSPCLSFAGGGPCSSHGRSASAESKSRWGGVRIFLCGDDSGYGPEEEACSGSGSEVAAAPPSLVTAEASAAEDGERKAESFELDEHVAQDEVSREQAAVLIQAAFRGFKERMLLKEMDGPASEEGCGQEPDSPNSASVEVQMGESISNLTISEESVMLQHRLNPRGRVAPVFRAKEDWDDSTMSCTELKMKIQHRLEAMNRRERAMAYAFSQQLRSCNTKKRSALQEQSDLNVGWSWLERWMATRQPDGVPADDCLSMNKDSAAAAANRRFIVIKKRLDTATAVEEKESCGSNDVSVSFEGCHSTTQHLRNSYQAVKSRLKATRGSSPQRKTAPSDNRRPPRSTKISKKGHHKVKDAEECNQQETEQQANQEKEDSGAHQDNNPPTDEQ